MKIAVLKVKEKSTWQSCQTISKNLQSSYELLGKQAPFTVQFCHYNIRSIEKDLEKICRDLKEKKITRLTIIDHFPFPAHVFDVMSKIFAKLNFYPEIYVHAYGCLMLWLNTLDPKNSFFQKAKIHFITASEAQRDLLAQFLIPKIEISVFNFPLDTSIFKVQKDNSALKESLGFKADDILLIYSGRAHIQKNLPLLIQSVSLVVKKNSKVKLLFAGPYDDGPINFLEYRYAYGTNELLVQEAVKKYGMEKNFFALGNLDQEVLLKYLSASDIFCSLSTYNDEDYGYAPIEAMAAGCGVLLTAWGGYKEFRSPFTSFIKVRREYVNKVDSLFISPTEVQVKLQEMLQRLPFDRQDISTFVNDNFSVTTLTERLKDLHLNEVAQKIEFNNKVFLDFKKKRNAPLHPFTLLETYKSYYA